jgi:HsdM N-terminal domain
LRASGRHRGGPNGARIAEQRAALCDTAGQAFYNTSKFTLRDLKSRGSQQRLLADFEDYLNGFSPNDQDILDNFKFRNQIQTLSKADAIGTLINKFLDPDVDLSPAGIDHHSMGTVFEEPVRKFNEENNDEACEHWTPRDAVRLWLGRHAHRCRGNADRHRRQARPAGGVPALRPGDQPRDVCRLQGGLDCDRRERRKERAACRRQ